MLKIHCCLPLYVVPTLLFQRNLPRSRALVTLRALPSGKSAWPAAISELVVEPLIGGCDPLLQSGVCKPSTANPLTSKSLRGVPSGRRGGEPDLALEPTRPEPTLGSSAIVTPRPTPTLFVLA
jgi:hypothetical protein